MRVLDTARLQEIGSLELESRFLLRGLSPDSRFAYVSGAVQTPAGQRLVYRVLDLGTPRVVAERTVDGVFGGLIPIWRGSAAN